MIKERRAASPVSGDQIKVGYVVQPACSSACKRNSSELQSSPFEMRTYRNHWSAKWTKALAPRAPGSIEQLSEAAHFDWLVAVAVAVFVAEIDYGGTYKRSSK